MVDVPLGTLIFRAGLLAEEQLEDALQEGMRTGKRLGEVLLERGWLHERDLGRLLAGQKGLPFVEVRGSDAEPAALQLLPEEKARLQTTLPLRYEEDQLVVAVADPSNELVLENLRRTLGSEPRLVVAAHGELMRAIGEAYGSTQAPVPEAAPILQTEPAEPVAPPALTPMPTVLPPTEERPAETPEVPPLQPLLPEPAAQALEPPPLAPPAPPLEEPAPAPVVEPPLLQPEPPPAAPEQATPPLLQPAETTTELAPEVPVGPPVEPVVPAVQFEMPVAEPTLAPPPAEHLLEPPVAPLLDQAEPLPVSEPPADVAALTPPVPEPPADVAALTPPVPEPPVEPPALPPEPAQVSMAIHFVLIRLREGDILEVGTFDTAAEAASHAQAVVRQIAEAEGASTWPFFAERYLRPDSIVSVDLLEEPADKWMGSAVRAARWNTQS
jgi:hypothetical protein